MGDIGMAMQRAEDKTEQMQARAGALDELLASGALQDATVAGGRDDVQSQLDALTAGHDVDHEVARMKAQLPASAGPPQSGDPGRHQPIRRRLRQSSRPAPERGPSVKLSPAQLAEQPAPSAGTV
jgi:phage shock protein A